MCDDELLIYSAIICPIGESTSIKNISSETKKKQVAFDISRLICATVFTSNLEAEQDQLCMRLQQPNSRIVVPDRQFHESVEA